MSKRKEYLKEWALKNKERRRLYIRYYHAQKKLKTNKELSLKDKQIIAEYESIPAKPPPTKQRKEKNLESMKKSYRKWAQKNRHVKRAIGAKYRASKLKQTPKWADLQAIKEFYKNCPEGYHVDHIIPLQGENVRGLHVLENLQYLTKSENLSKKNKY